MRSPFNVGDVVTTVICLVSRHDSSTLQSCRTVPVPINPTEPQSSVPDSDLDSGGTEEVTPWVRYQGARRLGMKPGTAKRALHYNMPEECLAPSRQSTVCCDTALCDACQQTFTWLRPQLSS